MNRHSFFDVKGHFIFLYNDVHMDKKKKKTSKQGMSQNSNHVHSVISFCLVLYNFEYEKKKRNFTSEWALYEIIYGFSVDVYVCVYIRMYVKIQKKKNFFLYCMEFSFCEQK